MNLKALSLILYMLIMLLSTFGHSSQDPSQNEYHSCNCSQIETSQFNRKRLVQAYGSKKLEFVPCSQTPDTKCEVCYKNAVALSALRSPIYPNHQLKTCIDCIENIKTPQIHERVLIALRGDKYTVGKILRKNEDGSKTIEFLETYIPPPEERLHYIKLAHEIIPSEQLCPICNFFQFTAKSCVRENCEKTICHDCFYKVPKCEYCRLLHIDTLIKIRITNPNLTMATKDFLKRQFGENFHIAFGYIKGILFSEDPKEPVEYIVKLSMDYNIEREDHGNHQKIWINWANPIYEAILKENEVEIFQVHVGW